MRRRQQLDLPAPVHILIDYRPALRERTGSGEYIHQLALALARTLTPGERRLTLFSSSWKDRLRLDEPAPNVTVIDRRIPVTLLNFAWHRLEWPPVELLAGASIDVVHSPHPLLTPARGAAQVVTIHDLDFLDHPERARAEIRRDYPRLARAHARRADAIVVPSRHVARQVEARFEINPARIRVCPAGAPDWPARARWPERGYLLFVGTLEGRKNVGGLLAAYGRLLTRRADAPELVLAGKPGPDARAWLEAIERPPLAGKVHALGYVPADRRPDLYENASVLVFPSYEEGFGLPVLEAMAKGVPVVTSNRGALPEVVTGAGSLVDPDNPDALAAAIDRILTDRAFREEAISRGLARAQVFSWTAAAEAVSAAYEAAIAARRERGHERGSRECV